MLASMLTVGTPSPPGNDLALDATVWNVQQREDRRAARKLLNKKMPCCILAVKNKPSLNYMRVVEVDRMWQLVVRVLDRGQGIRGVGEFFVDVIKSLAELVSKSLK